MKRLLILFFLFSIIFFMVPDTKAAEFSAGASVWYAKWSFLDDKGHMDMDPSFLYGPLLSMRFDESWGLSGVFLYGRFNNDNSGEDGGSDSIDRFDSDISLSYNINRYFKIFTGGKYMGFTWKQDEGKGIHYSVGPGLGIGSTLPLFNNFYLILNLSATYSWGKHTDSSNSSDGGSDSTMTEMGFNGNLNIAYYISSASTSINLGIRNQYFKSDYKEESESNQDAAFNFFGPTLSIVYTF